MSTVPGLTISAFVGVSMWKESKSGQLTGPDYAAAIRRRFAAMQDEDDEEENEQR